MSDRDETASPAPRMPDQPQESVHEEPVSPATREERDDRPAREPPNAPPKGGDGD